jgi:biopolymer transport protein ExbD
VHRPRAPRPKHISFKMTALIDMAFLLITFFVMSIRFGQAGEEEIKLPNADQAKEVSADGTELITVNVTTDGTFLVNGIAQQPADLYRWLEARKADTEKTVELVIRGDRTAPFEKIQRAMRLSAEAGITDVSLAALQQPHPGEEQ